MNPSTIPTNRLYSDLAWLWPLVSDREEYAEESDCWRSLLRQHLGSGRHHVHDAGEIVLHPGNRASGARP